MVFIEIHLDLIYIKTQYSYCYETSFDELFLSEKLWTYLYVSTIYSIKPKGILKQIRSHGFKTFGEFWDESYDDIDDPN